MTKKSNLEREKIVKRSVLLEFQESLFLTYFEVFFPIERLTPG